MILGDTVCGSREHYVVYGLALNGNEVPKGKAAVGLLQKMRNHHQQMQVMKKQNKYQVVLVTLGQLTIPVARCNNPHELYLNSVKDGGGNTCALECILLTGTETDGVESCKGEKRALPN